MHTETLHSLQNCVLSAGRLVSSASTTLTEEVDNDFCSEIGDCLSSDQSSQVRDWISQTSLDSLPDLTTNQGIRRQLSSPSTPVETEIDMDFIFDLNGEVVENLYRLSWKHYEAADFVATEQFVTKFLALSQKYPHCAAPGLEQDAFVMLVSSYWKQHKFQEAESAILMQIDKLAPEDSRLSTLLQDLAETYLLMGKLEESEKACQRAARGYMQLGGKQDISFLRCVELLATILERKGDLATAESYRCTFLSGPIVRGGIAWQEAVRELRKNGFEPANMTDESKVHALRWASEKGHTSMVQVIVQENGGIKNVVNKKDRIGKTALHYASLYGYSKIVKLLLDNGADPDIPAACTMSAIHLAAHYGEAAAVSELLDGGAQIEKGTKENQTALHTAACKGQVKVIELLLARGANINAADRMGSTALHHACARGQLAALKTLLLHHPDISLRDHSLSTALHIAAYKGLDKAIPLLLNHGADLYVPNNVGITPFMMIVQSGKPGTIQNVLEPGAPLRMCDREGNSVLHVAAERGNPNIVRWLVDAGAKTDVKNLTGKTAEDVARELQHTEIQSYLRVKRYQ